MANENEVMFTTRKGKQIPVKEVVIPVAIVVSLLRLQEDYILHKEAATLLSVTLDVVERGIKSKRASWKSTEEAKNNREFTRAMIKLCQRKHTHDEEIALQKQFNIIKGEQVELSQESTSEETVDDALLAELTEE